MKFFRVCIIFFFSLLSVYSNSQDFHLSEGLEKFSVRFQHVGSLILIPVQINGSVPLNFVVDTGSPYTIITNIEAINYFNLNKGKPIKISGLGKNSHRLDAYLSHNNTIKVGDAASNSTDIVLLFEKDFDLSSRFGVPIYGIIGYDLLKEFVVEVNYTKEKVSFYKHGFFYKKKSRKLNKFEEIPMKIERKKPYLNLDSEIDGIHLDLKLLIDTGSWDAVWLFENQKENINIPNLHIDDYLGFGLNGEIHGKKSRINVLEFGSNKIENPTASFPDSTSVANIRRLDRNGTLGSEILRRFTTIYDYKNQKLYIRKNNKFKEEFHYNMAGLELYQPYPNLPYLEVVYVRENSPADLAGLKEGDVIRYVNGKKIGIFQADVFDSRLSASKSDVIEISGKKRETISLPELLDLFKTRAGERIHIIYTRGSSDVEHHTGFVLQKSI